jgi:transcriptional regulator with XRE-family HTH domain
METIRLWRRRKGWTQADLAREAGVHLETISGIEAGRHEPRPSTLQKLAGALGVEVEKLFDDPKASASPSPIPSNEEVGEERRATALERWIQYIEHRAQVRKQHARGDNPFLADWDVAVAWELEIEEEFFDLREAAERVAAGGASAQELQKLEDAYRQLETAKRSVGNRVGEVLENFSEQQKETRSLERQRRTRDLKNALEERQRSMPA